MTQATRQDYKPLAPSFSNTTHTFVLLNGIILHDSRFYSKNMDSRTGKDFVHHNGSQTYLVTVQGCYSPITTESEIV